MSTTIRKPGFIVGLVVVAIVIGLLYVAGLILYGADSGVDTASLQQGNLPADYLQLQVHVNAIDTAKQTADLTITPEPQGGLTDDGGWTAKQDITFGLTASGLAKDVTIKAGELMVPQQLSVPLDGEISLYPFDKYGGDVFFDSDLPMQIVSDSHIQAFHASYALGEHPKQTALAVTYTFSRSLSITAYAIFIYILLALMAMIVVIVTISVTFRGYKLDFGQMTWGAALLFTLAGVRAGLPGQPPIGTLLDFIVFFWAEALVVTCLVTLVFGWLRSAKPVPPPTS